ncbi:hypothetical protein TCAL_06746 [Tigriopus californicus]|uniref:Innexin n=1 Tax=Tigriopus californicus TaxID=6832 RepID=A0A553PKP1_TIGCA|nr:innexin inx2-like [Tigriopus californicus]TRY78246.1 hypothetical protein TCAL_06746 [Tigriopus californicus]|eukprot:TCALIF_06746-PA protein Name:"Similar to Inx2 Innexin inx2 (Drosophila melanogaster)" AED:0.05 eAED:0.05 QI:202/1/1/1/0.75/0.8/5/144/490
MAEILGAANSATKFFLEVNQISIDNWTFKLFYKATTTILVAMSIICSSKQFFGDPINCEVSGGDVNDAVLSSYCWMYSTFNIPLEFKGSCSKREHDGTVLYNSYYQWVPIFLVTCAFFFYVPRAIWLMCEGGLMKFLSKGTTTKIIEDAKEKRENLVSTFQEHLHNKYNSYAAWFFCCEQLNLIIVVSLWFITNKFLKYQFLNYGPLVIQYYQMPPEERQLYMVNPMCEAFPRIAACDYIRYGAGGGQERKNAICILGLNMINDKVFLILWFWFLFLTTFSVIRFCYRLLQISSNRFRYHMMRIRISRYFKTDNNMRHIKHYVERCSIGDWFVLYQMSRNMNTRFFAEFLVVLSRKVNPDPGLADEEECQDDECTNLIKANGTVKPNNSSLSLHSQIIDLTYDAHMVDCAEEQAKKPVPKPQSADCNSNSSDDGDDSDKDLPKRRRDIVAHEAEEEDEEAKRNKREVRHQESRPYNYSSPKRNKYLPRSA